MALCLSAAVVACSGDDDDDNQAPAAQTPSDLGQSCTRTADCKSFLVCIDQVCEKKGTVSNAGAGNEGTGGSTGGTSPTGGKGGSSCKGGSYGSGGSLPAPVLGGEGESCTRAADCQAGLRCFNQRCTLGEESGVGGEGGMGPVTPPAPKLGERGETCAVSSDCAGGLACLPASTFGVGVCTVVEAGITPSGNDCAAECKDAADCCQLPQSVLTSLGIKSCADLDVVLADVDCTNPGASASQCFARDVYCNCAKDTWDCTNGLCTYINTCENSGFATNGCPTVSRSGKGLVSNCNDGHCQLAAVDPTCSSDSDCDGKGVADDPYDKCSAGECTCYKAAHLCYRKCAVDIDCAPGNVCEAKTHVCQPGPECSTDVECQTAHKNVNSRCDVADGVCKLMCATDLDCNTSLLGALTQVCNADHVCEEIGCTQDSECMSTTSPSVQMFCTPKLTAAESAGGPSSAITAGK
jgi:hypothetical protein